MLTPRGYIPSQQHHDFDLGLKVLEQQHFWHFSGLGYLSHNDQLFKHELVMCYMNHLFGFDKPDNIQQTSLVYLSAHAWTVID